MAQPASWPHAQRVLAALRVRAEALLAHMRQQREFRFYSSSLLAVYNAELADDDDGACALPVELRMIDHAHVYPMRDDDGVGDNGYVDALERLLRCFDAIERCKGDDDALRQVSLAAEAHTCEPHSACTCHHLR